MHQRQTEHRSKVYVGLFQHGVHAQHPYFHFVLSFVVVCSMILSSQIIPSRLLLMLSFQFPVSSLIFKIFSSCHVYFHTISLKVLEPKASGLLYVLEEVSPVIQNIWWSLNIWVTEDQHRHDHTCFLCSLTPMLITLMCFHLCLVSPPFSVHLQ